MLLPFLLSGCATFVKRYPKNKAFVYKTNINVKEVRNSSEKKDLQARLQNQLDDSLRVSVKSYPFWNTISKPPVYDSNNMNRSTAYMRALMNSLGYFSAIIRDTATIDTVRDQYRTTVNFDITPGKNLHFDSIAYSFSNPDWQRLAQETRNASPLKKGVAYSKGIVAQELDRIVNLLRNNGYYKVSREDVYAELDTVAAALIDPTLDPLEQAALLEQLRLRQQNPTIDIVMRQRPTDPEHMHPYFINKVTIYPDVPMVPDSTVTPQYDTTVIGKYVIITRSDKFRRRFLTQFTALKPGDLYSQDNYFKTITVFNQLGAWSQANVDVFETLNTDSLLDVEITLYPAKQFTQITDFEVSRNNANSASAEAIASSNLFGIGFNLGFRNRNFARQSIQTTTNARVGVEIGKNFFQTVQTSLSHNIYIPKFLPPLAWFKPKAESPRTVITLSAAYTDRKDFFTLLSTNVAYGYEWSKRNSVFFWRPLNIEYTKLNKTDSLIKLEDKNTYLKYAFNDGMVIGLLGGQFTWRWQKEKGRHFNGVRVGVEESGALAGLSKRLDIEGKLFRFVRLDAEYKHIIQYRKSALGFRLFGGVGFAYGDSSALVKEKTMPFFKQYVAGGPNSMRAWQVRQLGWGSYKPPSKDTSFPDRFGDIQLETNLEYRFLVATLPGGIKMGSAVYVDAGNIWLRKTFNDPALENADFNLGRIGKDLAIGAGTGLRFDFNFFLIRFDYAFKVKDPQREKDAGQWFYDWNVFNGQLQLGINYPF